MASMNERIEKKKMKGKFVADIKLNNTDTGDGIAGVIILTETDEERGYNEEIQIEYDDFEHFQKLVFHTGEMIEKMKSAIKSLRE